jgi:ankyrin repeat protein
MNDVPPGQPPSDDIDSFYRRASALDPSRPSDRTRQAVLAHAREIAAGSEQHLTGAAPAALESERTAPANITSINAKLLQRRRWWRPALFGTLAAAGLAGLLALPQILTPHVAPTPTYAPSQRSDLRASAPASATATPEVAHPPAAPPATAKRPAPAPLARTDASGGVPGSAGARDQPAPPESEPITVTAQRRAAQDVVAESPVAVLAQTESAAAASSAGASAASKAQVGSPQALRLAAESGDLKRLQSFRDQLTDINSRDDAGRTALLLATLHGQTKAVEFLLAHGADPNIADGEGVTPLSAATAANHSAIIRMLKHAGAH